MAFPGNLIVESFGRKLSLQAVDLAFVSSQQPTDKKPRRWVSSSDYPDQTVSAQGARFFGLKGFPDFEIFLEAVTEGFSRIRIQLALDSPVPDLLYEGHRLTFRYTGQQHLINHQTYSSYHSFAANGVMKEQVRPIKLDDGAPRSSSTTRLLYKERRGVAWWLTCLKAKDSSESLFLGAESAKVFKTTFTISKARDRHDVTVYQGLQREYLPLEAGLEADPILIRISDRALESFKIYGDHVASRNGNARPKPPAKGWASWYQFYPRIWQSLIDEQAAQAEDRLKPLGFNLFQVDDGYEPKVGDWTHQPSKFPLGLTKLAEKIADRGLNPGIWFAPFLVDKTSRTALEVAKPEWFLHDHSGRALTYSIPKHSTNYILDVTHPEVQEWLQRTIRDFRDAGYRFFKADFLFLAAAEARRFRAAVPSLSAYTQGLELIRRAAGDDVHILHSGSLDLAGLGLGDSNRTGPDIAYDLFSGHTRLAFIKAQMTATASHHYMAHRWFTPDADAVMLRAPLSESLAELMIAQVAMTGGNYLVSDAIGAIPPHRLRKMAHPHLLEIASSGGELLPLDYFENLNSFKIPPNPLMLARLFNPPRLWLWTHPVSGRRTLFAYNFKSRSVKFRRDLAQLCEQVCGQPLLSGETGEDLFHGLKLKLERGKLDLEIPAHSVRIFPLSP